MVKFVSENCMWSGKMVGLGWVREGGGGEGEGEERGVGRFPPLRAVYIHRRGCECGVNRAAVQYIQYTRSCTIIHQTSRSSVILTLTLLHLDWDVCSFFLFLSAAAGRAPALPCL